VDKDSKLEYRTATAANPEQEAKSLLPLLRTAGQTVADVLELIRISPD
jgi:hypothetical protein